MSHSKINLQISLILLLLASPMFAQQIKPPGFKELAIGDRAPDFKLMGIDGEHWTLRVSKTASCLLSTLPPIIVPFVTPMTRGWLLWLKSLKEKAFASLRSTQIRVTACDWMNWGTPNMTTVLKT